MKYYLFAKFFQHRSAEELMADCRELGLDGPTALIRDGYWVNKQNMAESLPAFVRSAQQSGLEVTYAETPFALRDIPNLTKELAVMQDCGITDFRVDFISKRTAETYRELPQVLRPLIERAAEASGKAGLRMIIQIHGGCYPHNATAAYPLVAGLDPRTVGVKIDPGNNLCQEGYELFDYQIELLGEYVAALGAKDACMKRAGDPAGPTKGWVRQFVPAYEGAADFPQIFRALHQIGFAGPAIFMPFYHENDFASLYDCLRREIAYLKQVESTVIQ